MTQDAGPGGQDLAGSVARGIGWTMTAQVITQVLGLLTSIVVARFLGPRELGLAAEALVFGSLALVIVDFGFAAALVQRPTLTEEDKSTAFWTGTALGLAVTLVGVGLSWPISELYGEPRVQPLFAVLSLAFLFTGPGVVQGGLLTRELKFRSLQVRTIVSTTVSAVTAMVLAAAGLGAWSIVAQILVITSVSTALLWRSSPWRPKARFSMMSLRGMARYTSHVFGTKALAWGTINLDNFLIGRYVGATPLGAYTLAFSMMIAPVNRVALPITQVFFPAFSQMRDVARIGGAWLRAVRMVALVVVPVLLGLIAVAPDFIQVIFGDEWEAAIPVIQILAPVGLIQALMTLNNGVFQALDRTRAMFRFTAVLSVATVAAFAIGLSGGIEGVAWAYLIVTVLLQPVFLWLTTRVVGLRVSAWLRSIAGVLQAGVAMLVVVFLARELLVSLDVQPGVRLAVLTALGALTYIPLIAWRAPEVRPELRMARERLRRTPPAPTLESTEARI